MLDIDNGKLVFESNKQEPLWEPGAATFAQWKGTDVLVSGTQQQVLRPWCECRVWRWRSLRAFLDDPLGAEEVRALPMGELDGATVMRLDICCRGAVVASNEPFYLADELRETPHSRSRSPLVGTLAQTPQCFRRPAVPLCSGTPQTCWPLRLAAHPRGY